MKNALEQLNRVPKIVFTIVSVILALLSTGSVVTLLVLPTYDELTKVNQNIAAQKQKVSVIKETLASLQLENKNKLVAYANFFNQLVPEQLDMPHFVALNEVVAAAVGAKVQSVTVAVGGKRQTQVPTAAGASLQNVPSQTAPTKVSVTYNSSYDVMLDLIDAWRYADQLVGVVSVKATGQADGVLDYTIEYFLPVSALVGRATLGENVQLTSKEKEEVEKLKNKVIYFATPSSQPIGKEDPFQ